MRFRSLPLALLLALALAVGGCGSKDEGTTGAGGVELATAPVADDLALLVPADADALLYVPDMNGLMKKVQETVAIFDADAASEITMDEMLKQLPIGDLMDTGMPVAVALKMDPDGGEPIPMLIASVTDTAAAQERAKGARMPEMAVSGSYVAMLMGPGEPATKADAPSPMVKDLPTGDLVLRANLAQLRETFGEQIDGMFDEAKDQAGRGMPPGAPFDMSKVMESMTKGMKTFMDSAEGLDIVVGIEDGAVNLKGMLTVKAGSPMDGMAKGTANVAPLAGKLPGGFPIAVLFSGDFGDMPEWMEELLNELFEAYPEDLARLMKTSMEKQSEFAGTMGNLHGVVLKMDEDGIAFSAISRVEDTDAYFSAWEDYYQSKEIVELLAKLGMEMQTLPPTTVAGVEVRHQRMAIDFEKMMSVFGSEDEMPPEAKQMMDQVITKMFGEDGLVVHTAGVDGYVVTAMGGGEAMLASAINAAKGTGTAKADLAKALEAAGGSPSFLVYVDGRAIAKGVLDMVRNVMPEGESAEVPVVPDGNPMPIVLYGGADGRYYMGGMTIDLQSIKDLVDDFMK